MTTDGRDTRWAQHRITRRRELVEHALRAIRRHGPGVGMDEIAAQAGTSKTVIYRHFGDRAGLYAAVSQAVHAYILSDLIRALRLSLDPWKAPATRLPSGDLAVLPTLSGQPDRDRVGALPVHPSGAAREGTFHGSRLSDPADVGRLTADLAGAYLALVERDPEIYRFVMNPPTAEPVDPAAGLIALIGDRIEAAIAARLTERGQDPAPAATWGHGLVGFVRAAADRWMASDPRPPADEIVGHITALFVPALTAGLGTRQ